RSGHRSERNAAGGVHVGGDRDPPARSKHRGGGCGACGSASSRCRGWTGPLRGLLPPVQLAVHSSRNEEGACVGQFQIATTQPGAEWELVRVYTIFSVYSNITPTASHKERTWPP